MWKCWFCCTTPVTSHQHVAQKPRQVNNNLTVRNKLRRFSWTSSYNKEASHLLMDQGCSVSGSCLESLGVLNVLSGLQCRLHGHIISVSIYSEALSVCCLVGWISSQCLIFFHVAASIRTGSVVLVVMDELGDGAEQVLLSQVESRLLGVSLPDLVMFHSWILLPVWSGKQQNQLQVCCIHQVEWLFFLAADLNTRFSHHVYIALLDDDEGEVKGSKTYPGALV